MNEKSLLHFYKTSKATILKTEYSNEIKYVNELDFSKTTAKKFLGEFIFVVLSAGMKNQAVQAWFNRVWCNGNVNPIAAIKHELKFRAIVRGINNHTIWFKHLKSLDSERLKIEYLGTLPFIGKITKYHLGRNIGLDCAKPDRWLVRLSEIFGAETPRHMCEWLALSTGDRIGVVDVVLWRYCNLYPNLIASSNLLVNTN